MPHKDSPDDRKGGVSNSTWNWYMDMHNWYIEPFLADTPISKFSESKAQKYIDGLVDGGLSAGTIDGVRRTLNKVMKDALKNAMIAGNPLTGVEMPQDEIKKDEKLFIERDVLAEILDKLDELTESGQYIELRFILPCCLYTGMRISEVHGLQIGDIDLKANKVNIWKQSKRYKKRDKSGKVTEKTNALGKVKTDTSKRVITMNKQFRAVVEERLAYLASKGNSELLKPDAFLFCNGDGKMRTYSGTRTSYERFMKRIKLNSESYTLHTFRHTLISHCAASGVDIEYVSKYVGHANSEITKRIYTHVTQEQDDKAIEAMNKVFEKKTA